MSTFICVQNISVIRLSEIFILIFRKNRLGMWELVEPLSHLIWGPRFSAWLGRVQGPFEVLA